jgi:alpha-L-fucosidase 2
MEDKVNLARRVRIVGFRASLACAVFCASILVFGDSACVSCRYSRIIESRTASPSNLRWFFAQGYEGLSSIMNSSYILSLLVFTGCAFTGEFQEANNPFVSGNDVTWQSLGQDENDSMPVGNGDVAANVWTEHNGDLVILAAKADAWTACGQLVKLGRVRVQLSPNPFAGATNFTQTLHLEDGRIEITGGVNLLQVWVDANHPVIHVEARLQQPATLLVSLQLWRTARLDKGGLFEWGGHPISIDSAADTVFPAQPGQVAWCHFNPDSIYPIVLTQEHLASILHKYPDPLLHDCFGAVLTGLDLTSIDDRTLKSSTPGKYLRCDLIALTETNVASPQAWHNDIKGRLEQLDPESPRLARAAHDKWWHEFWNRSWINVAGTANANKVSQGYIMQRYMLAASSRGAFPVKFNGGLFTVGHDLDGRHDSNDRNHNPDFRAWGNSYWNQNNRLLYWPLIATGDFDLLKPWFDMYLQALPLAQDRTRIYFHHDGASLPETMLFWGLPNLNDFGWDNPATEPQSHWQRYHIQGTLEVISQMLDEYDITQDAAFAGKNIVPFADAIVTFYDEHWPRDADGKIRMSPTQSLETYQLDAVNPTPDIAGLKSVLPRLVSLPDNLTLPGQRGKWNKELKDLPPIATGKTRNGKLADYGQGDGDGRTIILPAEKYGKADNEENPELYVAFPYRLYGVGRPDLTLAQDTFGARRFPQDTCWGQDGPQSAELGLTDIAKEAAIAEFTHYGDQRFRWFWKAGHDWIPDFDNGGSGMITLQLMLMQCDGKRIQLLPAWPKDWTADFKLHAPYHTTVEGHVENGRLARLKVAPESRRADVTICGQP